MAHGITELDAGVVWGTTWHNMPQYITLNRPVTVEEAQKVLDFPITKRQLGIRGLRGAGYQNVDAYALIRGDHVLVNSVGARFTAVNNVDMLNYIATTVMKEFPQLQIESVGTLWAGATSFLNLKASEFRIKGDESNNLNRIMWYNPLGHGSYKTCAHNIRVVCNNTLTAASAQGAGNKSLRGIRHTATGAAKVQLELERLASLFLNLESLTKKLERLALVEMTVARAAAFFDQFIPIPKDAEQSTITHRNNKRNEIVSRFEGRQGLADPVNRSAYGMLQAVTYTLDHPSRGDLANVTWDGLVGGRATTKNMALDYLGMVSHM